MIAFATALDLHDPPGLPPGGRAEIEAPHAGVLAGDAESRKDTEVPSHAVAPFVPPRDVPENTEALGDEIARLAAHLHAATFRLLTLIREFDEREGWAHGFRSCAEWLSWRTGIAPGPAREKVRVARALGSLPHISGAMARGEMSYSKVRALTRVATPENESELLDVARHATAVHVERLVRAWRRVDRLEEAGAERERHQGRYLHLYPDEDGCYVLRGRLDPEVGALLEKALEWAGEALYRREASGEDDTHDARGKAEEGSSRGGGGDLSRPGTTLGQRRADAMGLLAERAMVSGGLEPEDPSVEPGSPRVVGRVDRFQVVVHVDAKALADSPTTGRAVLEGSGVDVPAGTSRRLACDTGVVEMFHSLDGQPLSVGRRRRTVPPAIRRALDYRDRSCRFPGCGCRYTDAHHIVHWADGGETKLENLVLLCRRHHRAVHEEGFRVELTEGPGKHGHGEGREAEARFYGPDGRPIPVVPARPAIPADPVADLFLTHRERGVDPDGWTTTPLWFGKTLDLDLALDMLRSPLARARQAEGGGRTDVPAGTRR